MGIAKLIPYAAGALVAAQAIVYAAHTPSDPIRPPGVRTERDFLSRCIKCGRCMQACPYVAVKPADRQAGFSIGTPILDLRSQACRLCHDFPCIAACPTAALQPVETVEDVAMGTAVIDEDLCIAMQGMRCEVCYRVCPLIDSAITIDYRLREEDPTHTVFAPIIHEDACVGCGLCVERCVVGDPEIAIRVVRMPENTTD